MTPVVVAHRGDPVHETENTLAAFRRAVADGAATVELDVQVTADGVAVVLHDETTERLWGEPRAVAEQTWDEVSALVRGEDRISTLAEVFEALPGTRVLVDVTSPRTAAAVVEVTRAAGRTPVDVAFCGTLDAMRTVRAAWAEAPVWLPLEAVGPGGCESLAGLVAELDPEVLNADHTDLSAELVSAVVATGLPVAAWTVDDPDRARELAAWGVASITSNRAADIRRALVAATTETGASHER